MKSVIMMAVEGGVSIALLTYIFSLVTNIMDSSMTQTESMLNAIDSGDAEKMMAEAEKTDKLMKGMGHSSLSFLENVFSSVDISKLNPAQKDKVSEALQRISKMKADLGGQKGDEKLGKELDELAEYLKG